MFYRILFASLFCLLSASVTYAGAVIKMETVEHLTSPPVSGTIAISTQGRSTRLDIISNSGESTALIFDGAKQEMIVLEHSQKKYFVMTKEQMEAMAVQVSSAMQQMEAALAAMPPEQRAMAEKMMKSRMPAAATAAAPSTQLNKVGGADSVAGYSCENYEVTSGGRRIREMCVSSWDDIEGGRESADAFMEFAGFFADMREAFSGMGDMSSQQDMFQHIKEIGGYPVLSREFNDAGTVMMESRVVSASSESLSDDLFTPPADYQQQSMN